MNDNSGQSPGEIKFVGIGRVSDSALLLVVSSDKTKKAYFEEVYIFT